MIAFLLASLLGVAQAAPSADPPMPSALGPQVMPRQGCAAFLWSVSDRKLVAVANAGPATLRIALGGKPVDYARVDQSGAGGFGFAGTTRYATTGVAVTLEMIVSTEAELTDGGMVQQGTLTIDRQGAGALLIPVAGVIGCAAAR
jgi:hypothetical protein